MQFVQVVKPYLAVQDGGHTGVHALLRSGSDKCAVLLSDTNILTLSHLVLQSQYYSFNKWKWTHM